MTSFRIAFTELRRLTSSRMARMSLVALAMIPALYGGLYLWGNHDPYGNLKNVPAALVVQDTGARDTDGKRVTAGADVAEELVGSRSFDWHRVDPRQAAAGVEDGTYDFALTIPRDFSAALVSSADLDPRQAQLRLTTNDANSYLSTTIASSVVEKVRAAIAEKVGTQAAANFLLGLSQVRAELVQAADGAGRVASGAADAHTGASALADGARRLDGGATRLAAGTGALVDGSARLRTGAGALADGLGTLHSGTADLPAQTRRLAAGARQVADGNDAVAAQGRSVATAAQQARGEYVAGRDRLARLLVEQGLTAEQQQRILDVYDGAARPIDDANQKVQSTSRQLDRLANGADQVADGNARLAAATPQLVAGVRQAEAGAVGLRDGAGRLHDGAAQADRGASALAGGAGDLADGAARLDRGLGTLERGSAKLSAGLHGGVDRLPATDASDRSAVARTIGDPVAVRNTSQAEATSYGAGLAPFFMGLATWIGAYALFLAVRALSRRAMAANQSPLRVAVGGWLTPALLGLVQVGVLFAAVLAGVGIVPAEPVAMLAFMVLASATFVAILHLLNAWLGPAGQFLGLVLLVLQLISAGGTFPWQTLPGPLRALHHVLPMSYAVDGNRQLLYGGLSRLVVHDALVLGLYLVVALALTSVAARRQRVWTVQRIKPEIVL